MYNAEPLDPRGLNFDNDAFQTDLPEDLSPELEPAAVAEVSEAVISSDVTSRTYSIGMNAIKTTVIAAELTPVNETLRYGALGLVLTQTQNPYLAAGLLGASTFLVEGTAAVAAAGYVAEDKVGQLIDRIDERLEHKPWLRRFLSPKHIMGPEMSISPMTEAGIALGVGTVAAMEIKQRQDRTRTAEQARLHGLKTAAWMSGVLAVEGALIAEGVENIESPLVWGAGLALIGASSVKAGVKKLRNLISKTREKNEIAHPRYDLSAEELSELENSLVETVKTRSEEAGIHPVIIRPEHRFANVVRAYEAKFFPEVADLPAEVEDNTAFLALVDTREGIDRVVHAATVSGYKDNDDSSESASNTSQEGTGFFVIDDLVEMGNFSAEEFKEYYASKGYDLNKCISLETNFRVGDKVPPFNGMDTVSIGYLSIFKMLMHKNPELGHSGVFASINRPSIVSFGRRGLAYELLMDRDDLLTSEAALGLSYKPVLIPYQESSKLIFEHEYPIDAIEL